MGRVRIRAATRLGVPTKTWCWCGTLGAVSIGNASVGLPEGMTREEADRLIAEADGFQNRKYAAWVAAGCPEEFDYTED